MLLTQRLSIQALTQEYAQEVFDYRSDHLSNQYQGWIPESLDQVERFIENNPPAFNIPETWFQLVLLDRETRGVIGDIGVHFKDPEGHQCELGCTLAKEYQSYGYATEAMKAVITYLFDALNKHRITLSMDPDNLASVKLSERLGFRLEAHFKESYLQNGIWKDDLVYAILNKEWQ